MNDFVYIPKDLIDQTLTKAAQPGKRQLEPLKSLSKEKAVPLNILEDHEVVNEAEVHEQANDLWLCIEGEVLFTCGGNLVEPRKTDEKTGEWKGKSIEGGTDIVMKPGDWLWIPKGVPHLHRCEKIARLYIIKT